MEPNMVALHSHWLNADAINVVINVEIPVDESFPSELQMLSQFSSSFRRISVFYSLLYVVVEGYREQRYSNEKIDTLLEQADFIDALRLFRNATFHYQKEPIPEKALKFLETTDSEKWIQDLHIAFRQFFEQQLPILETTEKLKA
ncbi:hypothetical protein RAL73_003520 [Vibrio cholerae]|nr:hypothetical protein [Vibrio cholerae]ELG4677905.1 hypothetical protein [Vibrio cholerae]